MTTTARSELRVAVSYDHDGECVVTAIVIAGEFRGRGDAWLDISDVEEFAASARRLAESSSGEAVLRGGYFNPNGSPDCTVNLAFRPLGSRGPIVLAAELSAGPLTAYPQIASAGRLFTSLILEPAGLERFAAQLTRIRAGSHVEATVGGESAA